MFNSLPWERTEVIQTQDGAGPSCLGLLLVKALNVVSFSHDTPSLINAPTLYVQLW